MKRTFLTAVFTIMLTGVASACPDWELDPAFGSIELNEYFPNDPYTKVIEAGGNHSVSRCFQDNSLSGTVAAAPDFDLYYRTSGSSTLNIYVRSGADTVLLISDPYGEFWFDDDSGGGDDPLITFPNAVDGLYNIWVGSYNRRTGEIGTLVITERTPGNNY
ncbi:MAG: peptidase S1 [Rhodospirillaceae bacterium]|mgnify:CR=1 FL=1|nr:peptidase S1 [Rhodospirillaceae bacterium]|tara:strand:+ start:3975 stop:4457 length:483 start_codon:yes stop_codon:yes gene_type:complete